MTINTRVVRRLRELGATVYTRKQWGAKLEPVYQWRRVWRKVPAEAPLVVQHITVTHRTEIKEAMRLLERIGWERFKSGVSYQWAVDMKTGEVGQGMPLDARGTHTLNDKGVPDWPYQLNAVSRGIAVIGMPGDTPSTDCQIAVARIMAAMVLEGSVAHGFKYKPHSLFANKDCPTEAMRTRMVKIRRMTRHMVESG